MSFSFLASFPLYTLTCPGEILPCDCPASRLPDFSVQILPLLQKRLFLFTLEDLLLTLVLLLQHIPTCPFLDKEKTINLHFSVLMSLHSRSLLLHVLLDMLDRPCTKSSNSGASYFSYYLFPPFRKHQSITHRCTGFSYLCWLYYLKRKKNTLVIFLLQVRIH